MVEETYDFGRHTGVCLEGRAILADYNAAEHTLTVHHATQAPHMMQDIFSRHLDIPESNVRVICRDVGGSFGIKVHVYPDEMATAALSVMLRRPVKFVADRLESFLTDIHAREHRVTVRLACTRDGDILAFDLDDLTAIGPYSVYPRTSGIEGNQVVNLTGGPYRHKQYRAKMHVVFTNKNVTCQYRAVGHPIAVALTEGIVDLAARKLGMDPAEFRRRNLIADDAYPYTFPSGIKFEKLSHHQCLDKLLALMDYKRLRAEQAALRKKGIHRGLGLAAMIEVTNPSPAFYGVGGARISAQDGATLRLDPAGMVNVLCSVTEQGQGTEGIFAQIAASVVGVSVERVRVTTGDTGVTPYGGGTWASRGAGIGGEAVLQAGKVLRSNILDVAAAMLNEDKAKLDIVNNEVVDKLTGAAKATLAEVGRVAYFRPDTLPMKFQSELTVTRHYTPREYGFTFTNGIQASWVEVDVETGFVKLLKHWCVEDCGTIINPMLVDEQIRGGVVQGIGAALFEECLYGEDGQLLNGNMADYLVPMAGEMPDIVVGHVETPTLGSELGAKGAGEAGTAGAPGAVMNAINDALAPLGAHGGDAVHAAANPGGARQGMNSASPPYLLRPRSLGAEGVGVRETRLASWKGAIYRHEYRSSIPRASSPPSSTTAPPHRAILEYLEETVPRPPLLPADARGRARVRGLAQICVSDGHPLIVPRIRNYLERELHLDEAARNRWLAHWTLKALEAIEAHLASERETGRFCHGDAPTIADICLASQVIAATAYTKCDGVRPRCAFTRNA